MENAISLYNTETGEHELYDPSYGETVSSTGLITIHAGYYNQGEKYGSTYDPRTGAYFFELRNKDWDYYYMSLEEKLI